MEKNVGLWENYDGFLLAFNADGSSICPFYKKLDSVPKNLQLFIRDIDKLMKALDPGLKDFDLYSQ